MEFDNTFSVQAPPDRVYTFMLNAREVAPCVPGAQITEEIDEHHFKGSARVKVGPVQMTYRGELEMQPNEAEHVIVLKARGTEARGGGGASGTVTTRISPSDSGGSDVAIHSQIDVSGRAAQFGRGLMQDVATKLIKEFAQCLEAKLEAQEEELVTSAAESKELAGTDNIPVDSAADITASGSVSPPPVVDPNAAARIEPTPEGPWSPESTSGPESPSSAAGAATRVSGNSPLTRQNPSAAGGASISITGIVAGIVRARVARGLRALADLIEE